RVKIGGAHTYAFDVSRSPPQFLSAAQTPSPNLRFSLAIEPLRPGRKTLATSLALPRHLAGFMRVFYERRHLSRPF
ncbi:hypothetical protein, partial [Caballeronia sordidicola]|uniref:hypothetical protein n=1 Tax=Caballeronia sordidicola TaxID=196367 RepID=UPI001F315847